MKRIIPAIIIIIALAMAALSLLRPMIFMGQVTETWETANQTFKVRIDRHAQRFAVPVAGAYYVISSAPVNSNVWREITAFSYDDPLPIPPDQVRFINDQIGYVFMGWTYAATMNGGNSWSVWKGTGYLSNRQGSIYELIRNVRMESDGIGVMVLNPSVQAGEVSELRTKDFGQHWSP